MPRPKKDIPRHKARIDQRAADKTRDEAIQAMRDAWIAGRSGNPNGPITNPQEKDLLRILAAQMGLIDPD